MSRRVRRRSGLVLLAVLAIQAMAAPIGVCAHQHEGTDGVAPEMTDAHASDTGDRPMHQQVEQNTDLDHSPHGMPTDCLSLAACGTSAVEAIRLSSGLVSASISVREVRGTPEVPAVIVLGLVTPPPKV